MKMQEEKQRKDTRKERLAKQLRANLARRKEQARERGSDERDETGAPDSGRDNGSSARDT